MHHHPIVPALLAAAVAATTLPAFAQGNTQPAQPIDPQVQRREVKLPKYPSRDIALGAFVGTYGTQNFGSSTVSGVRIGYHVTEDIFVEATLGQTKVSDDNFRQILPGGIFVDRTEKLSYYAVSAGWNVFPGEVFFGRSRANAGFGWRLLWNDRLALQADVRNHMFSLDLLGKRQSTQNLEVTGGLTLFF
jgi:hypothetical protein